MQRTQLIQKGRLALLAALIFSVLPVAHARTNCQRPKGNPYECNFAIQTDGNDVWIGVNDPKSSYYSRSTPLYVGRQWGGPVGCQRFSGYFYAHRAQLSQISCGIGYHGLDPNAPSAYIYVKIGGKPFHYPPSGPYKMDYLELGSADYYSIQARAERELDNCNRVLEFVKGYESACPR